MDKLDKARIQINKIDEQIAMLFEARLDAVCDVIEYKKENGMQIFDESREKAVVSKNLALIKNDEYKPYYAEFIQYTMNNSKKYQRKILNLDKVAYQGYLGAFSHIATTKLFKDYTHCEFGSFEDVFKAVENGEVYAAVVPFENSFTGEIGDVFDLFTKYNCYIESLYDLKIDQNLLGLKGSKISDITDVFSHPQALAQSREYLSAHAMHQNLYANTALAAKFVAETGNISFGAVASKETAEIYGLSILAENINTSSDNTTRFAIIKNTISNKGERFNAVFKTSHKAGALARVMSIIANDDFNVSSIKSRAIAEVSWEYYFYIEIDAKLDDEKTQNMIKKVKQECAYFKVIGCYF